MREIQKTLRLQAGDTGQDFRLTKLDAFSGAFLLRLLARLPETPEAASVLAALPEEELRRLMTACLEHCEVLLPAGWMPVMTRGEWTWPDIAHDAAACLKLTLEEVLWTLEGFFSGGGSASRKENPASRR